MANTIKISHLNPYKFVLQDVALATGMHIRHLDEFRAKDQLQSFQDKRYYCQPVQNTDPVYFQVVTNYGPISCKLIDEEEQTVATATITLVSTGFYTAPESCFSVEFDFTSIAKGCYQMVLTIGSGAPKRILVSEPLHIDSNFENTVLLQYGNTENKAGLIFENGEQFHCRVEGILADFQPGSNDSIFEDQTADLVTINSTPFRTWKLGLGNDIGLPDWLADRINRIFGCDAVLIDNKAFSKSEGQKMERTGDREYPFYGWQLEVRERVNYDGITLSNEETIPAKLIFYGVQDTTVDPSDFSLFETGSPYADITINYGDQPDPKVFWMAHIQGATEKTNWIDLGNALNTGGIDGSGDLFEKRIIDIDGDNYVVYITKYVTGFTGSPQKVKFYNPVSSFEVPPNWQFADVVFNYPTSLYDTLTFTWDAPSIVPLSYTIKAYNVTDNTTQYITGITALTYDLAVLRGKQFSISIKAVYSTGESDYSSIIEYPA